MIRSILCWLGFHGSGAKEKFSYPSHALNKARGYVGRTSYGRFECTECKRRWVEKDFI